MQEKESIMVENSFTCDKFSIIPQPCDAKVTLNPHLTIILKFLYKRLVKVKQGL